MARHRLRARRSSRWRKQLDEMVTVTPLTEQIELCAV